MFASFSSSHRKLRRISHTIFDEWDELSTVELVVRRRCMCPVVWASLFIATRGSPKLRLTAVNFSLFQPFPWKHVQFTTNGSINICDMTCAGVCYSPGHCVLFEWPVTCAHGKYCSGKFGTFPAGNQRWSKFVGFFTSCKNWYSKSFATEGNFFASDCKSFTNWTPTTDAEK